MGAIVGRRAAITCPENTVAFAFTVWRVPMVAFQTCSAAITFRRVIWRTGCTRFWTVSRRRRHALTNGHISRNADSYLSALRENGSLTWRLER